MIALEGMAAGKPVISSRTPGMEEMLGDAALLIDAGNTGQLRDSMLSLISSPDKCTALSERARRRVREQFDMTNNARILLEIYRKVVDS